MTDANASESPAGELPPSSIHPPPFPSRLAHVPRLSIAYLLLWTTVTAAGCGLIRFAFELDSPHVLVPAWGAVVMACLGGACGWFVSGAALIAWHAARRTLWRLEPGEWLVLGAANIILTYAVVMTAVIILEKNGLMRLGPSRGTGEFLLFLFFAELAAPFVAAAVAQRGRRWWAALNWFFCAPIAFFYLMILIEESSRPSGFLGWAVELAEWLLFAYPLLVLGLLVGGVVSDRRRREPRHWLHWSGVALAGSIFGFYTFTELFALVARLMFH